ncbi:hypothetical protein GA0061101_1345 [Rhizobium lusitanum]|uniref:Uncharacterized protein n=1 Tax=Rhizobium lusitanum TaxID=293958 RepID=A0A1C3XE85_9HYPH|nr:hypothetical protein GA0061101_1345 [Rhizobium lusitanum]
MLSSRVMLSKTKLMERSPVNNDIMNLRLLVGNGVHADLLREMIGFAAGQLWSRRSATVAGFGEKISHAVDKGSHAVLILDQATRSSFHRDRRN